MRDQHRNNRRCDFGGWKVGRKIMRFRNCLESFIADPAQFRSVFRPGTANLNLHLPSSTLLVTVDWIVTEFPRANLAAPRHASAKLSALRVQPARCARINYLRRKYGHHHAAQGFGCQIPEHGPIDLGDGERLPAGEIRSEERRVGKECRYGWTQEK